MPFSSDSMYSNAGLYRQTLHDMLYTPRSEQKKKSFEDLSGVRKVSKLLNKFETGELDLTVEESVLEQEYEDSEEWDLDESIFEDPVFASDEQPSVPKPRTILFTSTPKASPEKKKVSLLVETPILRQAHRKAGGYDNLRNKFDQMNLVYRTSGVPRQKANSIRSTCSSIGSSTSSSILQPPEALYMEQEVIKPLTNSVSAGKRKMKYTKSSTSISSGEPKCSEQSPFTSRKCVSMPSPSSLKPSKRKM